MVSRTCVGFVCVVVHSVCEVVFLMGSPFLFYGRGAGADATDCRGHLASCCNKEKDWITPALLASEPVLWSPCINPRLSLKMSPRARIYALYGRSVRARGSRFSGVPVQKKGRRFLERRLGVGVGLW